MRLYIEVDVEKFRQVEDENQLSPEQVIGCFVFSLLGSEYEIEYPDTSELLGYITLSNQSMTWNVRVEK